MNSTHEFPIFAFRNDPFQLGHGVKVKQIAIAVREVVNWYVLPDLERLLGDAGRHSQVSEDLSHDVVVQTIGAVNPQLTIGRAKNSATGYEYPAHGETEQAGTLYAEKLVASGRDQDFISARGTTYVVTKYVAGQSAQLASTAITSKATPDKPQSEKKQKPVLGRVNDPVRIAVQAELQALKDSGQLPMFEVHRPKEQIAGEYRKLTCVEWLERYYGEWKAEGKLTQNVLRIIDPNLYHAILGIAKRQEINAHDLLPAST